MGAPKSDSGSATVEWVEHSSTCPNCLVGFVDSKAPGLSLRRANVLQFNIFKKRVKYLLKYSEVPI